jgi:hypothetical protein
MTAQVVILNKLAAAVASDSNVTVSGPDGQLRAYSSAERIFSLPAPHTLAVLHNGSAQLLGVPYMVLIEEWAGTLPDHRLDEVTDYGDHFSAWLTEQGGLFTADVQDEYFGWMVRDYFLAVRNDLVTVCQERDIDAGQWQEPSAVEAVDDAFSARLDQLRQRDDLPGWEHFDRNGFVAARRSEIEDATNWVFDDTPRTAAGDAQLVEMAAELLRVYEPWPRDGKLVFVGFGESELFAAQQAVTFQGLLDDRLRAKSDGYLAVGIDHGATITPFGPTETTNTFLRAFHLDFLGVAHDRLDESVADLRPLLRAGADGDLDKWAQKQHQSLNEEFERLSWNRFVQPLFDAVAGLPPAELARMTEALVGLQIVRELTQAEADTVGGPIDVAVITRSGGLRWVRHQLLGSGPAAI